MCVKLVIWLFVKRGQARKTKVRNQKHTYYFDIEKYKVCYKEDAKSKMYSISIKSTEHKEQEAFQNSDEFKMKAKSRYNIEAKNSEMKHRHGYDVATSTGLFGMRMQGAMTIIAVNLKRIITLMREAE